MQKVSTWSTAKKATLLIKARAKFFALYGAALIVLSVVGYLLTPAPSADIESGHLLVGLFNLVFGTAVMLSLHHFVIASCRNKTSLFPASRIKGYFRYLFASISVSALACITGAIGALPMLGWTFFVIDRGVEPGLGLMALYFALALLMFICALFPLVRFGFIVLAAAIGDSYTYSGSWRMTKGHTGRLLLWTCFLMLPSLVGGWIGGYGATSGQEVVAYSPMVTIIQGGVGLVFGLWGGAFTGVLYEDFRSRHEAMGGNDFKMEAVTPLGSDG